MRVYAASRNSDQTEGRGHAVDFAWYERIEDAVEAVQGEGTMGVGVGDVFVLDVLTDLTDITANRGPVKRQRVYGQSWAGTDRGRARYEPGWDPRGEHPEYQTYQRLRRKFGDDPA